MGNVICRKQRAHAWPCGYAYPARKHGWNPARQSPELGNCLLMNSSWPHRPIQQDVGSDWVFLQDPQPWRNLEVTKGPSYRDRYFHISVTLETNHSTLKLYIIMTVVTKAKRNVKKLKHPNMCVVSQSVCSCMEFQSFLPVKRFPYNWNSPSKFFLIF